jgi:peptidoglycan/LPS O-acetylase OafA/YrhL
MAGQLANDNRSSRLVSLDLLRLLAIVLVLGRHMELAPSGLPRPIKLALDAWYNNGWLGTDLFFVLSGFLVSGLLFAEYKKYGDISLSRFYVRRAWKIYPAFYFLIAFTYFYYLFVIGYRVPDRQIYSEILFIQSYQTATWNHTWTLAVEEHFYLALPIILGILVSRNRGAADPFRAVPWLVGVTAVGCIGARIVNWLVRADYSLLTHTFPTHLRIDSLFFGVAIAYAYHFHSAWLRNTTHRWRHMSIFLGVVVLGSSVILPPIESFYINTFGFTQFYVGAGLLLLGLVMCDVPNNRFTSTLATLGSYSYSIYLWHMALMYLAIPQLRSLGVPWPIRTAVYIAGAFVIGVFMAKLLELPALRFRDRRYPSRSANFLLPTNSISTPDLRVQKAA